ncbi:DUF4118 domain-containing protein [Novosphingobium taihuense]|uniref:Two-component system sensor histidine kinase KdpD n=1 Tax=Novosphingobium taihuense TaxID=260085 RepID=A0A7W7AE58_9SPHN|nr:DUF4118 domain-containing protein [Novosphingobium taihuense]MBB4615338.1 two-component system sensor histidine kinase KdpD [Novosphingobium taihuense]TWH84373.1 two-component system sensor histidine kinase KdpD [Novosphingobium taihuense]
MTSETEGNSFAERSQAIFPSDERVCVVLDDGRDCARLVALGYDLAQRLARPWEAVSIETPGTAAGASTDNGLGAALGEAAALGASIHRVSGATTASAVAQHLQGMAAPHIVLALRPRGLIDRIRYGALVEQLAKALPGATFHVVAGEQPLRRARPWIAARSTPRDILLTVAGVMITMAIALLLREFTGATYLSILFLFPVLAASARLGMLAAAVGALLSTVLFNLFFLAPGLSANPLAVQSWVMALILLGVGTYTSWLTGTLRSRINLSDRNAQESAALASFAQDLTRVSDWTSTAEVVCREINRMLGANAIVAREIAGRLEIAGSFPESLALDPLDEAALDWAWTAGEMTGSGSANLAEASWQFHPLKTSLGTLAVLGLSKGDGRDPVMPQQKVLLATMIAQASLAHERLRLEAAVISASQSQECGT